MSKLILWVENYLFYPNPLQKFISFLLLPFSFIYCFVVWFKRAVAKKVDYGIPIVSIGNLTVGGSGKTPTIISLAKHFQKPCVILRGYKRKSKGMAIISDFGKIQTDITQSGDEAMLYAKILNNTLVIVSEDRIKAIKKAKKMGAKIVFLDDGFSKANIKKLDILIKPNPYPKNTFCLPSGAFREPSFYINKADIILEENKNFTKHTSITNKTNNMSLVTSIAKASRLDRHLPKKVKEKFIFPDHYDFKKHELDKILQKTKCDSLLVTRKDWVKLADFNLPLSFLELEINISDEVLNSIKKYQHSITSS